MRVRSSNSCCRRRSYARSPMPPMIHCVTLPQRCSRRLPMLFDASFGRHHMSSSVKYSRDRSIFGRYSDLMRLRHFSRNACDMSIIMASPYKLEPGGWLRQADSEEPPMDRQKFVLLSPLLVVLVGSVTIRLTA